MLFLRITSYRYKRENSFEVFQTNSSKETKTPIFIVIKSETLLRNWKPCPMSICFKKPECASNVKAFKNTTDLTFAIKNNIHIVLSSS